MTARRRRRSSRLSDRPARRRCRRPTRRHGTRAADRSWPASRAGRTDSRSTPRRCPPTSAAAATSQVIESNDSYWVHAFRSNGGEAPGFPKYTGQWPSFSGVVGDPGMNGRLRLAYGTREGYAVRVARERRRRGATTRGGTTATTSATPASTASTPAARRRSIDLRRGVRSACVTLAWTAPGDDHQIGTAARYEIGMARMPITATSFARARLIGNVPRPAPAGTVQTLVLPAPPPVSATSRCGPSTRPGTSRLSATW